MVLSLEMKTICNSTVSYESDIWNFYNDLLKHSQSETGVTFFIYYHDLPVNQVIKNNLTNVEKSFRSNFGDNTNKLFEEMFPSTKELGFTSRFEKIISNVPEVEIVNTSESFLIKNQKIIVFSLISITIFSTLHYILNNKDLLQPEWFPDQRPNVIVKNAKCVLENNRKLNNAEFIYYIVNKLKEGKRLSSEEISQLLYLINKGFWKLMNMLKNGLISIYLIALFIKILMVIANHYGIIDYDWLE